MGADQLMSHSGMRGVSARDFASRWLEYTRKYSYFAMTLLFQFQVNDEDGILNTFTIAFDSRT